MARKETGRKKKRKRMKGRGKCKGEVKGLEIKETFLILNFDGDS
jgi:hypothetical protein